MTASILCIHDDPAVGVILEQVLSGAGHRPILVSSIEEALREASRCPIDLIIADERIPGPSAPDRLERDGHPIPVIILTASGVQRAVVSAGFSVVDYLTRPIRPESLEIAARRALEMARLRRENETFRREIAKIRGRRVLVGESEVFRRTMGAVSALAGFRTTVLLQGESGTGKKSLARAIHDESSRADGPFITVNCAGLPEGLVESALFGHEEGGLAGATVTAAGAVERAHGGTLLLEEISELRVELQPRVLRLIEEQQFERTPGRDPIRVDVRVLATTNRHLGTAVDAGRFRSDLYHRLQVLTLQAPTLRERPDDIPRLVEHFLIRAAELGGRAPPRITPETLQVLLRYPWPGNVRELANAVERAVMLCQDGILRLGDFDQRIREAGVHPRWPAIVSDVAGPATAPVDYNLDAIERMAIDRALAATGGNRTRAARLLGISERTLRNKLNTPRSAGAEG